MASKSGIGGMPRIIFFFFFFLVFLCSETASGAI